MAAKNDERGAAAPTSSTPVMTPAPTPITTPAAAPVEEALPQPAPQAAPTTATQANEVPANEPATIAVGASPEPASVADQIAAAEQASPSEPPASLDPEEIPQRLDAVGITTQPPVFSKYQVHHLEPGGSPHPPKLPGKPWIKEAYKRNRARYIREATRITAAAKKLADESTTAADCAKPLGWGYIKGVLRQYWHTPRRERSKQRPKQPSDR
jgi:hypothetical protein